jgi:hypothetical protein
MIAAAWVISLVLWPPWIYAWPYIEGDRKVPEGKKQKRPIRKWLFLLHSRKWANE